MKIKELEMYHGAVLTQIVKHDSFKALNKASNEYGHYLVNADKHLFVKFRKGKTTWWQFIFTPDELSAMNKIATTWNGILLCLVCGEFTICALKASDIKKVIDLTAKTQQSLVVSVPKNGSCWVKGSAGELKHSIPHNSFPNVVFS